VRVLRAASYAAAPWKNGGGVTHEIARSDADASPAWRLSVATIDRDGPFSNFSGCDRTIVPIDGAGFELAFDDGTSVCLNRLFEPFAFAGEARVSCRLVDGRSRDFNVITRRDRWTHAVQRLDVPAAGTTIRPEGTSFVFASGAISIRAAYGEVTLEAGDTLELTEPGPLAIAPQRGAAALLAVTLRRS
jgi:uncharacterized protein